MTLVAAIVVIFIGFCCYFFVFFFLFVIGHSLLVILRQVWSCCIYRRETTHVVFVDAIGGMMAALMTGVKWHLYVNLPPDPIAATFPIYSFVYRIIHVNADRHLNDFNCISVDQLNIIICVLRFFPGIFKFFFRLYFLFSSIPTAHSWKGVVSHFYSSSSNRWLWPGTHYHTSHTLGAWWRVRWIHASRNNVCKRGIHQSVARASPSVCISVLCQPQLFIAPKHATDIIKFSLV